MSDVISLARGAREQLAGALASLQAPGVPPKLLDVAQPVAMAMGMLHNLEQNPTNVSNIAPHVLDAVRNALSSLQTSGAHHPALDQAVEKVAGSLKTVHALAQMRLSAAPAPKPSASAQAPGVSQPPQAAGAAPALVPVSSRPPPASLVPRPAPAATPSATGTPGSALASTQAGYRSPSGASSPAASLLPNAAAPRSIQPSPVASANPAAAPPIAAQPIQPALPVQTTPSVQPTQSVSVAPSNATAPVSVTPAQTAPLAQPNAESGALQPAAAPAATANLTTTTKDAASPPAGGPGASKDSAAVQPGTSPTTASTDAASPSPQPQAAQPTNGPAQTVEPLQTSVSVKPPAAVPSESPPVEPQKAPPAAAAAAWSEAPQPAAAAATPTTESESSNGRASDGRVRTEAALGAHSPTNFYKGLSGNDVVDDGGIFIATYLIPKVGQPVELRVTMPGGYEFEASGVVRWTRDSPKTASVAPDSPPGFGARFTDISQEGRQLVYRYVRNREPMFFDDM